MTNVEDMDTYISSYIVQNRASPFADRDLIIRNPEELNRTRVTTRDSYTLVKYVSLFQKTWTWTDYHQDVRTVAKAFISLGFARYGWIKNQLFQRNPTFCPSRFDSVCILGFNAPEWVISDVAAIFAGGFASGIYPTNGPEACKYILEQSNCSILVVEDGRQLDKVWALRDQLPHLKKVRNFINTFFLSIPKYSRSS